MTRKSLILSVGVISLIAGAGQAATITLVTNGGWNTGSNWDLNRPPADGDHVVIPSGKSVQVDINNAQADSVEVSGTMTFAASAQLTVDNGAFHVKPNGLVHLNGAGAVLILQAADALDVDPATGIGSLAGRVRIDASNAVVRLSGASSSGNPIDGEVLVQHGSGTLDITANVTVIGNGKIEGSNTTAQITIANGATFTSTMAAASGGIRGFMQIGGTGTFANQGRIEASGGVLEFAPGLAAVNDNGSATWAIASTSNSQLLFSRSATTLQGDFVTAKALVLGEDVDVWTCGELSYNTGSTIDVDSANSKSFRYFSFGSSSCSNPSDGTTSGCSDTVFMVNTDKLTPCS